MSAKQLEKRESIVQELLSTEKNYVNRLGLVITHFLKPLSENADSVTPFISRANLRAIFSELTVVHGLNLVLLNSLEKIIDNANPVSSARVGRVFVKVGSFLRWYQSYVSNYDHAFQTLKKLKTRSPGFRQFITSTESKPELGYTDLESLLILPVQRVPQYNMLFSDLAKVTTVAHPDFNDTNAALQLLNQIGSYINEKKREAENIAEVIAIGKTLVGFPNLAVPYRRFVRKTAMFSLPDSAPSMQVVLFAFNDVLLLSQETEPNTYNIIQYAYWDRVVLCAPESNPVVSENPMAFQIRLKEFIYLLVASTPDEKTTWCNLVKENVEHTKRKSAEKEIQVALKKKMLALHNSTPNAHDSLAIRSLGVLAKGMLQDDGLAGDSSHSPTSLSNASGASSTISSAAGGALGDAPLASGAGASANAAPGGLGSSGVGFLLETPAELERRARALEQYNKSKKTRELIETEVRAQLTKDGIKDGSIEEYLVMMKVEASYVVPLNVVSKVDLNALLAISQSAVYLFSKARIIFSGFLCEIKEITSKQHPDFSITFLDGTQWDLRSQFCDDIIYQLRRAYLLTYYGIPETYTWPINTDEWRQPTIFFDPEKFQFGGFARTFRAACTYLNISYREDLVWDIVHNPTNHKAKSDKDPYSCYELDLSRLEELTTNDLKCLMLALRFNSFFTSLVVRDVAIPRDGFAAIADMLKYNQTLRRLVFVNNSLGKDHLAMLTDAFNTAPAATNRKLEVLEIRDNNIEAVAFLTRYLDVSRKSVVLRTLDLSNSGLGAKAMSSLFTTLRKSTHVYHTLMSLKIAGCKMDSESSAAAAAFLATPCALKHLDASNTQIKLLQVLEAITRGCIYLETLDISHNKWIKKIEPVLVKFITKTDSMTGLKLNGTGLGAEALAHIIEAASTNVYLSQLKIFADENNLGPLGASLISKSFKEMKGIVELSLCDNDFGDEGLNAIFQTFAHGTGDLQRLLLDGNFKLKTAKGRAIMLKSLVKMTCSKSCKLVHLSIAGAPPTNPLLSAAHARSASSTRASAQLRLDLLQFLDCLPRARIAELNISGHRMGPRGILALGRSLQECRTLTKVWWDENGTTLESFLTLVHAISSNTTLTVFHPPLVDLASLLGQGDSWVNAKLLKAVEQLSSHISANVNSLKKLALTEQTTAGRRKSESKPYDGTKSTTSSTGSNASNASSTTSKILKEAAQTVLFSTSKSTKKTAFKSGGDLLNQGSSGEIDSSSMTPPQPRTVASSKSIKPLQVGKATQAPSKSSSETKAPKSARGHMEMTSKSKAASATAKALKAEQAASKAKTSRAGGSSKAAESAGSTTASTDSVPAPTSDALKSPADSPEEKRSRSSSRHLRLPSNNDSSTNPAATNSTSSTAIPALGAAGAATGKNSRPNSTKMALNETKGPASSSSPRLSASAAALITNITSTPSSVVSSASNDATTSEETSSKSNDYATAASSSIADDTTNTENTSGELTSTGAGRDGDDDDESNGGSRSETTSDASEAEILELDEHYDENEDEDYRIEDQPPEPLTDSDIDDEEPSESDDDEVQSPRRSHYRDEDDPEDGGPGGDGDDGSSPLSPNSARIKSDEEQVDADLDEAIASSTSVIPSSSTIMTPNSSSPVNLAARSRKPHLETSLSLALLKNAAESLPTDLAISDSEDDSLTPQEEFHSEDPTDEESGTGGPTDDDDDPSDDEDHDNKSTDDVKAAVAHEYGALSLSDSDTIEVLKDDDEDDEDDIDRSAFDRPPTMPLDDKSPRGQRSPRSPRGDAKTSPSVLTPRGGLLSPRDIVSTPRGGASSVSPGSSPVASSALAALESPRRGSSGSPTSHDSEELVVPTRSRFSSGASLGAYEPAPVMPATDISPVSPRGGRVSPSLVVTPDLPKTERRLERKDADIAPVPSAPLDVVETNRRRFQSAVSVGEFESIPSLPADDKIPASPRTEKTPEKPVEPVASSSAHPTTSTHAAQSSPPAHHSPKHHKKKKRRH